MSELAKHSTPSLISKGVPFSTKENEFLKQNAGKLPVKQLAKTLNRSYLATRAQLDLLELPVRRRDLLDEEVDYIISNWGTLSVKTIAKNLNRNVSVIYRHAKAHGMEVSQVQINWTPAEEELLIELWDSRTIPELAQLFKRSEDCIRKKGENFGLKRRYTKVSRWDDEEKAYLIAHWGEKDVAELAKYLDRTPESVRQQAGRLKLKRLRNPKDSIPWTDEEREFLISHWDTHSVLYLMRNLKKTYSAIYSQAARLGLGAKLDAGYTAIEVSRMLGYSTSHRVLRYINKGYLKANRSKLFTNNHYSITEKQLKSFMKAHPDKWSFETITFDPFYDTNGKWIEAKRKSDREAFLKKLEKYD